MAVDIKNKKQVNRDLLDSNFPVVKEDDTCPYWESVRDTNLIPMRECWYCKFSDFRKETKEHLTYSVCRCPKNRINKTN